MSFVRGLNKKLNKMYEGQVAAHVDGGCLVLSGELQKWSDIVVAGKLAVEKSPYFGFVNDIECTGEKQAPTRKPRVEDSALEWEEPDVLIIGGGVIGCAIARELSRYKLNILLVEKEHDLAMQASGRNNGIVQSGAGLNKNSQKYRFARQGNVMFESVCEELGVDYMRSGQFVCYPKRLWDPFLIFTLLYWKWMGIKGAKVIKKDELRKYEPALNHNIRAALHFTEAGIVCPFDLTLAYAENAVSNGVNISLNTMVESIVSEDGMIKSVVTNRGTIKPKVVVNAAGVYSDIIAAMAGDRFYSIHPVKGTTAVLDKKYSHELINTVVTTRGPVSAKKIYTRDESVVQTINGNILVGSDSFETIHREDFSTSPLNLKELFTAQSKIVPDINEDQIITYFSGIRAATYSEDFIVCKGRYVSNLVHAAGIQIPGLTASPAIGVEISRMVLDFFGGESSVGTNPEFNPKRIPPIRLSYMDDSARSELIESNPDYGVIICRCEEVSKGEIINALRRNVRCDTLDGVKRRVRAGMGRCNGNHCIPQILDIISSEKRLAPQNVRKSGSGSEKVFGNTKTLMQKKASAGSRIADRFGRSDSAEASAKMHKRAQQIQAIKNANRKDANSDDYE